MSTTDSRPDHDSNPLLGLGSSAGLGAECDAVLFQLEDRTNQTWVGKRKRWAALVKAQDAEIQRLRLLTFCGCGDQFTPHDPGTCGACVAGMTCDPAPNVRAERPQTAAPQPE